MKITKYEHACLVVEESFDGAQDKQGKRLVIDPGNFAQSLPAGLDNVVGIVITHVHADHFDQAHLNNIMAVNQTAVIFCPDEVASQLTYDNMQRVSGGSEATVEPFRLQFSGGKHAMIHPSFPIAQNVGVMVNGQLYYPGDSFTLPTVVPPVLALPVNAPWLKMAESIDFLMQTKPKTVFPTHNAFLSQAGNELVKHMLSGVIQSVGGTFTVLDVGQSLNI